MKTDELPPEITKAAVLASRYTKRPWKDHLGPIWLKWKEKENAKVAYLVTAARNDFRKETTYTQKKVTFLPINEEIVA